MARLISQTCKRVAMSLREIPDIAYLELVRLSLTVRRDHRRTHVTFQHISPFRGDSVPVQFAEATRIQPHRDAGNALGKRELSDSSFLGLTSRTSPSLPIFLEIKHKVVELFRLRFASAFVARPETMADMSARHVRAPVHTP